MDHEQLIENLRACLRGDRTLQRACESIQERFNSWPVLRKEVAGAVAGVVEEQNNDVRHKTANLVDRLVREGFFREHPGGALLHPAVPLDTLLNRKRKSPKPIVITFRADVPEPPAPMAEPAVSNSDDPDAEEQVIELSPEEAVLIGLYTVHLGRHRGLFSRGTVIADLQQLFRDWHLPAQFQSARAIHSALVRYLEDEILEVVEEVSYQLTERGLQDAKAAKSAWEDRH